MTLTFDETRSMFTRKLD